MNLYMVEVVVNYSKFKAMVVFNEIVEDENEQELYDYVIAHISSESGMEIEDIDNSEAGYQYCGKVAHPQDVEWWTEMAPDYIM